MKKVVEDCKAYGSVQNAWLGVSYGTVTAAMAHKAGLSFVRGVQLSHVQAHSPAAISDLQVGDVITALNKQTIRDAAQFQERFFIRAPNDVLAVTYYRNGHERTATVALRSTADRPAPQKLHTGGL